MKYRSLRKRSDNGGLKGSACHERARHYATVGPSLIHQRVVEINCVTFESPGHLLGRRLHQRNEKRAFRPTSPALPISSFQTTAGSGAKNSCFGAGGGRPGSYFVEQDQALESWTVGLEEPLTLHDTEDSTGLYIVRSTRNILSLLPHRCLAPQWPTIPGLALILMFQSGLPQPQPSFSRHHFYMQSSRQSYSLVLTATQPSYLSGRKLTLMSVTGLFQSLSPALPCRLFLLIQRGYDRAISDQSYPESIL